MSDPQTLLLTWIAGASVGTLFFGGLWWTVRRAMSAKQPALWVLGSLILRMSTALAAFYVISGRHLDRLLLCLLGFFMARLLVTRLTRSLEEVDDGVKREASHAS